MPATTLESRDIAIGSAQDILQRLERYAAARRAASLGPVVRPAATGAAPRAAASGQPRTGTVLRSIDAATVDLFPYDLIATIAGCAATILASIAFATPVALVFTVGLAACGEWARRNRWFPSAGTNLVIGTVVGVVLVVVS